MGSRGRGLRLREEDLIKRVVKEVKSKGLKFKNKITVVGDIVFRSKKEAKRYEDLLWQVSVGMIKNLERQPSFPLVINGTKVGKYTADFYYFDNEKQMEVYEDVKGYLTNEQKFRIKVFKALYPDINFNLLY